MKRIIYILSLLLLTIPGTLLGQPGTGRRAERIHAIKVAYLTDRLSLSSSQAATFWPVYDSYESEIRDARRSFMQKYRKGGASENDADSRQFIEDNLDFQEQALGINRKYKDQFLKIITPQQLATLYEAERDFKKLLLQQLRQRRERD
jgi:hypothetical protein